MGLEAAVTELGCGVDELEGDLLQGLTLGVHQHGLQANDGWSAFNRSKFTLCDSMIHTGKI